MHHQKTAERFTVDLAISMILAMALLLALIVVTQGSPLVRFAAVNSSRQVLRLPVEVLASIWSIPQHPCLARCLGGDPTPIE
jgi:hypothetical protein